MDNLSAFKKYSTNREFVNKLKEQGLFLVEMKYDGNCLFRALGFQAYGTQETHKVVRVQAVDVIASDDKSYSPFLPEETTVEQYCEKMRKEGEWGGNLELMAISRLLKARIVIHQYHQPVIEINDWDNANHLYSDLKTYHLSYHDGNHYNALQLVSNETNSIPLYVKMNPISALVVCEKAVYAVRKLTGKYSLNCMIHNFQQSIVVTHSLDSRMHRNMDLTKYKEHGNRIINDPRVDEIEQSRNK